MVVEVGSRQLACYQLEMALLKCRALRKMRHGASNRVVELTINIRFFEEKKNIVTDCTLKRADNAV